MCDGFSAVASIVMTAVSTAISVASQQQQAQEQKSAARASAQYSADQAAQDAATQRLLAQNEITKGVAERTRQQRAAASQLGDMTSMLGGNGFALDSGSPLSLLADGATEAQHDSNLITQNAQMAAWQHLAGATGAENQKSMFNHQAAHAGPSNASLGLDMSRSILGGIGRGMGQFGSLRNNTNIFN